MRDSANAQVSGNGPRLASAPLNVAESRTRAEEQRLEDWLTEARSYDRNEPHDIQSSMRALEELSVLGVAIDHGRKKYRLSGAI